MTCSCFSSFSFYIKNRLQLPYFLFKVYLWTVVFFVDLDCPFSVGTQFYILRQDKIRYHNNNNIIQLINDKYLSIYSEDVA